MTTHGDQIYQFGGVPVASSTLLPADMRIVCREGNYAPYKHWYPRWKRSKFHSTILSAYNATEGGKNETVLISPDNHSQAAGLTWAKNMTHLIGAGPPGRMNLRTRIGHSANFATLLTVSGEGNLFQNLYFMHGRGSNTNVNLMTVSGDRNTFINVHFGGPFAAAEADFDGYDLIRLLGSEAYFKHCYFGSDSHDTSKAMLIELGAGCLRPIFEDCIFLLRADATTPCFIKCLGGLGEQAMFFLNCTFINMGSSTLAFAIDGTGLGDAQLYFDHRCSFDGVSYIVADGKDAYVHFGSGGYQSAITSNLFMAIADHST